MSILFDVLTWDTSPAFVSKTVLFLLQSACRREASPCRWWRETSSRATSAEGRSPRASAASWSVWWTTRFLPSSVSSAAWVRHTFTDTFTNTSTPVLVNKRLLRASTRKKHTSIFLGTWKASSGCNPVNFSVTMVHTVCSLFVYGTRSHAFIVNPEAVIDLPVVMVIEPEVTGLTAALQQPHIGTRRVEM